MLAAAQATDALVLAAVALGALLALTGLASFDPRIRSRLPTAALAGGNVAISVGLVIGGVVIVGFALGLGD